MPRRSASTYKKSVVSDKEAGAIPVVGELATERRLKLTDAQIMPRDAGLSDAVDFGTVCSMALPRGSSQAFERAEAVLACSRPRAEAEALAQPGQDARDTCRG